nr:hypothetical protein BaRGS_005032 [Batillaria attramentaria]
MSGDNERPPPSPRRQRRSATPGASGKSYMDMYQQRRAATPGPTSTSSSTLQSARPTTPGPGTSSSGLKAQQQFAGGRRGSLSRTVDLGQLRKAKSVTSLVPDSGGLSLAGGRETSGDGTSSRPRGGSLTQRAQTTDSQRRLQRQNACDGDTEGDVVLMVSRGRDGHHSVSVTDHNENVTYSSAGRSTSGKTAQGRLQQSASFDRPRSKTPGPGVSPGFRARGVEPRGIISRKHSVPSAAGQRAGNAQNKPVNRTEAWVDSTLNDPKRKQLPPRPKRAMTPNSLSVHESELMSRPLEEIQAVLPSPEACLPVPDPECLEAPPEDPEMYRKMEQLFEKYREMELRASVCDTPGGGGGGGGARQDYDTSSNGVSRSSSSNAVGGLGSSGGGGSSSRLHRNSVSSRSTTSLRTSLTTTSGSVSSGVSSARSRDGDSSRGTSVENDRFSKESSPAAAAATPPSYYSNGAASFNYSSDQHHNLPGDDSACVLPVSPTYEGHMNGAPAVSAEDIVDDIPVDPELIASNPTALVSKIKEILKVRPRKEDPGKTGTRSRIPAPAPLSRSTRSKSMSNLSSSNSHLHLSPTTPDSAYTDSTLSPFYDHAFNGNGDVTRDESTNSDVSSELSRCETPVPKLAQPLTTGRSTLFRRERSNGALRAMSQDDRVSTSSSQSSSSRRYWDEEGEYV